MKTLSILVVFLSISLSLFAQNPNYVHIFNHNYHISMYTDSTEMWVGNIFGLIKYDINTLQKQEFTKENCGLPYRNVRDVTKDQNGNVWIAGDISFAKWSGGQFTIYDSSNTPFNGHTFKNMMFDSGNNLWLSYYKNNDGGLAKFDGSNWTLYDPANSPLPGYSVSDMTFDKNGVLWLSVGGGGSLDGGLMSFDGTNWIQYDSLNTVNNSFGNYGVAVDTAGVPYASTINRLYRYNGTSWIEVFNVNQVNGLGPFNILGFDHDNNLWLNVIESLEVIHLVKYDGTAITNYTSGLTGYCNYWNYCSAVDANNKLWLGGQGGLQTFDGSQWQLFHHGIGPSSFVTDVVPLYNGKMQVSTGNGSPYIGGIGQYDGDDWNVVSRYNSGLLYDAVTCMAADKNNNVWIGTSTGNSTKPLYKLTGNNISLVNNYPGTSFNQYINQIVVDSANKSWFLSNKLYSLTGNTWATYDSTNIPGFLTNGYLGHIAVDSQNNLWLFTYGSGGTYKLFKFDGINWTSYIIPYLNSQIRHMSIDANDKLWFPTFTIGAITFDGTNWDNFSTSNSGILTDTINMIGSDNSGIIYAETYWGKIMKYDGIAWVYINIGDQLINYACKSIRTDEYNNMYFCNGTFLTIYNPGERGIDAPWLKNKIKGNVFYDMNQDGIKDPNDPGFPNQPVTLVNDGSVNFSDQLGNYSIPADLGLNTFSITPSPAYSVTNGSGAYAINVVSDTCCYDFGLSPQVAIDSLDVTLSTGILRCGFDVPFYMNVRNDGTAFTDATLVLHHPSVVTYVASGTAPSLVTTDSVSWNLLNMYPGEVLLVVASMNIPNTPGLNICTNATVQVTGSTIYSDVDLSCGTISCSFDPNDKSTEPVGAGPLNCILKGSPIEYMIRFQNLGNDTAFTVRITDTLSTLLNWQTFEVIGFSAPVQTQLSSNGVLKFTFDNIRIPPESINEPGSNGFVKFRIWHDAGLPDSTIINNTAQIYFDFNQPIFTNNAFVTLVTVLPNSIYEISDVTENIIVSPNPFTSSTTLRTEPVVNEKMILEVYDIAGKIIYSTSQPHSVFVVPTQQWDQGIYFYNIHDVSFKFSKTGKLVKQR